MTTSCRLEFVSSSETVAVGEDRLLAAKLTEELSPIGATLPMGKLEVSLRADSAFYARLIEATKIDAYRTLNGTEEFMGRFYLCTQELLESGCAKFTLVDIIGMLENENWLGDYYNSVSYGTFLNKLLGTGNYSLDASISGTLTGLVGNCTKRQALQQFAIAAGAVIDATRSAVIRIYPPDHAVKSTITAARKVTGHKLTQEDAVAAVDITYRVGSAGADETVLGSGVIPANSTGTIYYKTPGVLTKVGDYDATDMTAQGYWAQMGMTVVESTAYGITLSVPDGIPFKNDPWNLTFVGKAISQDKNVLVYGSGNERKSIDKAEFLNANNAAAAGERVYNYYACDYVDEGSVLPGNERVCQRAVIVTPRGSLTGFIERIATDLYGGSLQKMRIRGTLNPGKAPGQLNITPTSMTLDEDQNAGVITAVWAGDGTLSAASSDTEVADVSVSGGNITVTAGERAGTANITVSVSEGTYHLQPASQVCTVTVNRAQQSFSDCTWSEIITACQSGSVPCLWSVGDCKEMTIGGTVYQVDIIGMNHDSYADGSGTAPVTFQLHDSYGNKYAMNGTMTNSGGWESSQMRQTSLPVILAAMPSEVQTAIRQVSKLTSAGDKSTAITTTADKLFLLSEVEAAGTHSCSIAGEGSQYAYYAAGNSRIKKVGSSNTAWWLRSPYSGNAKTFCQITETGAASNLNAAAYGGIGVSPAWCF